MDVSTLTAGYRKLTYFVAAGILAAYAFSQTTAGQALMVQYPRLTGIVTVLGLLAALVHKPANKQ